jgi:hypothetical protein
VAAATTAGISISAAAITTKKKKEKRKKIATNANLRLELNGQHLYGDAVAGRDGQGNAFGARIKWEKEHTCRHCCLLRSGTRLVLRWPKM